jgi:hypothetical protein
MPEKQQGIKANPAPYWLAAEREREKLKDRERKKERVWKVTSNKGGRKTGTGIEGEMENVLISLFFSECASIALAEGVMT